MFITVNQDNRADEHVALRSMFEARKRVFVDLLKWDLPVLADRFEVDHFDDPFATYLIVTDGQGEHLASARLLPTTRPALLDGIFPYLVDGPVPHGTAIFEITRFCLSPGIGARQRRAARDTLLVGLVEHALAHGISTYTGVAELSWFRQVERFGWDCRLLGETAIHDGRALVALAIAIEADTPAKLAETGIVAAAADAAAEAA
ncbi:Acyl-homoserine-lactone synthase [Sphingobium herbicidovorans NBRC 16415]|uniref:Acyl-homoserine-lactone synthase n=1 Tax=Sphingobium herbicidovorans (strain ATCC 700291 / DSM 11019 / CCUG 56400 / KCTC 2939 / LMG 18315 / NBRC 16415 / MH) TaxID=1219045 RepID=A0A086P7S5_SPHHM|nr:MULTISPECIES: acyl-homoserine-lactone synthase [Sphingomonadaceae]KFG89443.1 Acyl-homoserine-lactone synthase [Sphingobium herbicidovorans NBRC 16415]